MRKIVALAGLLLALPAAKPVPADGPGAPDEGRERWRGQTVAICVAELRAVPALSPDEKESICGCAADRLLDGNGAAPLPPATRPLPLQVRGRMAACTMRIHPDATSAVMRLSVANEPALVAPPVALPPNEPKPVDTGAAEPAAASQDSGGSGGGFWDWVSSLGLPAWLTETPLLWIALGIFVFGLLILRVKGRDPRRDLSAPPSSMRRGTSPQPPRRPDLPR